MRKAKRLYPRPAGQDPDDLMTRTSRIVEALESEIRTTSTAPDAVFSRWRASLGQARAPQLAYNCWTKHKITVRTLRRHLGSIWHTSDIPDYWLDHDQWRELFHAAGYTRVPHGGSGNLLGSGFATYEPGERATAPTRPIRVYRGAIPERRDDWSWTASPAVAARWASGQQYGRPAGRVWTTLAPPAHVLCRIDRWDQYVIDTHELTITEHKENPS